MKLRKPPYPDPTGTGLYYVIHTGYRKIAIDLAVDALRALPSGSDQFLGELSESMREWTIEVLIQGAWIREYHKWETDTKDYFDVMHARNGRATPNWKNINGSHVEKIEQQLALFSAKPPASMAVLEETRQHVNDLKHKGNYLASKADYESLIVAVERFWDDLEALEEFTPPDPRSYVG